MPRSREVDPVRLALGTALLKARLRRGMSREVAATVTGLAGITLQGYETGHRAPDYATLLRVCRAYGTVPSRIVMAIDEIPLAPLPPIQAEEKPPRRRKWR